MKRTNDPELELVNEIASFASDPLGFVYFAFPWGEPGELEKATGPEPWQKDILNQVRDGLPIDEAIQIAVTSGHGVGKSALVAWLILWAMATKEDTKGIVTANTEQQLKTKTWSELGKWNRLCICKHWFTFTATALVSADKEHERTWRIDMVPWSENRTEAFAGLHNQGGRIIVIFDEASAIPDVIWEVTEGALTDENTEIIWATFGNPTRNTGRFRECFRRYRHRWKRHAVDSRDISFTNKDQIKKWADDYGEDSDFFKVRVKGEFPSQSDRQFISTTIAEAARGRHLRPEQYTFAPKIIGVDPAWTGGDEFVIWLRQGLMSKKLGVYERNDDDVEMAGRIAYFEDKEDADGVLIDQGWGTGVYSAGKTMGRNWQLISFGSKSPDPGYLNLRAYIWGQMKKWLIEGGAIPDDQVMFDDLVGPEYVMRPDGVIKLESKDDMKSRGVPSPNRADALAITFAMPFPPRHNPLDPMSIAKKKHRFSNADAYNPLKKI